MPSRASPPPPYPFSEGPQPLQSSTDVLASFVLEVELSDERENRPYRQWEQEEYPDPEQYLWARRTALSRRVEREVQDRLQLTEYRDHVRFEMKVQRGSITVLGSVFLVGMALVEFVTTYKDFYDGLNLLIGQVQDILGRDVEDLLGAGGGSLSSTGVSVHYRGLNTPLPSVSPPPQVRRLPLSPRLIARNLVRLVGVLIAGMIVLSYIPATRPFIGELWPLPNLTRQVLYLKTGDGQVRQANFTVANLGLGPAEGVYINIDAQPSKFTSYHIIPQEAYRVVEADLQNGVIRISLERMSAGSFVEVLVASDEALSFNDLRFSAVSKSGASQERLPEDRSSQPVGLRYVAPTGPLELAASAFISNQAKTAGQSPSALTWDGFVAIILSPDFLRLAATSLVIALLAAMTFNSLVFQLVVLVEILVLTFVFFYPYQVQTDEVILIVFLMALFFLGDRFETARKKGDLKFEWKGWREFPDLNNQTLKLVIATLSIVVLFLLAWLLFAGTQVSIFWPVALFVAFAGAWLYLDKSGLLEDLVNKR